MKSLARLFTVMMSLLAFQAAGGDVYVVGLFKDRAVVMIDGKRRVLSVGQRGRDGVRLISATSEAAVLEIDGERRRMTPETRVSTNLAAPVRTEVRIRRDVTGMYRTVGSINRMPVAFMVDTGATTIAMNSGQARRLGIDYLARGKPSVVSTASGYERVYQVNLDAVRVGDIELRNVAAAVLEGDHPTEVLLGMSFLGRLKMENDGAGMILRKKF